MSVKKLHNPVIMAADISEAAAVMDVSKIIISRFNVNFLSVIFSHSCLTVLCKVQLVNKGVLKHL